MNKYILTTIVALLTTTSTQAQNVYHFYVPENASGPSEQYFLPAGTPLAMRTLSQVSTKDNKPGERIYLEVAESVVFRNQIIIPVGSPVTAEIAATQRNGHFGKKGKIEIRLIDVMTPHGPVRLTGSARDEGISGTAASVATILLVSPLGFLIHGTSAHIQPGTAVSGQLLSDLKFRWYPKAQSAEQFSSYRVTNSAETRF
jgi:hypothetical protein